mmetsp:Transcript_625/g.1080  ORF Transcript_625/g.1080 Transcript_625/m.1080 type:complete len:139 (+) Transcript_625:250-666(+)|eukprot:CAMPEP_0184696020 /NCGR_PEP_ID=MMETSP0313-20130426/3452_1 /TAXON_ID=2792 /ORGANISM="Porphyridium aerugineum, Strain SAG 1380-2" /LENGTH=138 /DNA_ID=CAMNT_0027154569 /DNA_START=222 /DNA_END=638 /DNA_ORIENTATION=+
MNTAFVSGLAAPTKLASSRALAINTKPAMRAARTNRAMVMKQDGYEISEGSYFDSNPVVIPLAVLAWVIPSSIPSNIPLFEGKGLTPAFIAAIQDNLSRYPKGPELDDPFWTLCFMFHLGMFATLIFGSIGYNLSKSK